jgi:hypothetical protein
VAKKINKVTGTGASAQQFVHGDGRHVVEIKNISVAIYQKGKRWIAQGVEIDYIAQGNSVDDVKRAFEIGLEATINQHLKIHGDIDRLLKFAPDNVLLRVFKRILHNPTSISATYSQVSVHDQPYFNINYVALAKAA